MARRLVLSVSILVAAFGLAAQAQAETITGTFQYLDRDAARTVAPDGTLTTTTTTTRRPIVAATVEIYACPAGASCERSPAVTATTDATGSISESVTRPTGTTYALRVYATNDAAVVWPKVVIPTDPYYQQPGEPDGAAITRVVTSPTNTLDFSYDFDAFWPAAYFNMADTIRLGRQYAMARRDPLESDLIPQVSVQPSSGWAGVSHYNFTIDQLLIKDNDMLDDPTLLHEYAHFLEEKISKFAPIASNHDGCKATAVGDATATPINSPEHAWMEGFADYFAAAVITSLPSGRTDTTGFGIPSILDAPGALPIPTCMAVRSRFPSDMIEIDVAGVLWDLLDGGSAESTDTVSGRDVEIFRIFDHELSTPFDPTIEDFRAAWVARKLPAAALGRIYTLNGLTFGRNLAPIADAGPDRYIPERLLSVLDGSLSEDPETAMLSVTWTQTGGPPVTLSNPSVLAPTFMAPSVGSAGATLTFRLDVSDAGGLSATDFVQRIVRDVPGYGELAPSSLDFGVRRAGVKTTKTVTLTNIGPGWLELGTKQVTGSPAFALENSTCAQLLRVNESCTLSVAFVPPGSGAVSGWLTVATQNSPNAAVQVPLRGEGGTPSAVLDAGSLAFGQVNMGASSSQQIRLSNTGTVPVAVASVTTPSGTAFSNTGCPATIPVGGSCLVTVTFRPTAAGPSGAWLIFDDDGGGGPRWVQLSGTGLAVGAPSVTPGALAFGSLGVGNTSGSATVALTNYGGASLYVWDVRVYGHYADFRIVSDHCRGASLQPFASCVVHVAFTPQATGTRSGTLEFATNGVVRATLTGTGVGKPAHTAWAQLGFGPTRGGFNAQEIGIDTGSAASLSAQWEVPLKAEAHSSPAVVGGIAYLGTDDGSVHAVEVASQTLVWSAPTGGPVRSSPAVVDGVVYVGSEDGSVYAFDAARGTQVWTFATTGPVEASPAVENGIVLVGSLDGNVYALNAADGKELWTAAAGGPVSASPALNGTVAYTAGGNVIRALDLKTGRVLWYEHVNAQVRTLTVADGLVLAGTETGRVYALSAASGAHQWALDTAGSVVTSLAAAYGIAYVGSDGGDLTAYDAASGAQIWSLHAGRAWSGAAIANGVVYLTSDDGELHAIDAWTGAEIGAAGANALSSPAVVGGAVYVGTSSGLAAVAP